MPMATYYHGAPQIQPDGLQTLYLMNPSYADATSPSNNLFFLSSATSSMVPAGLYHAHAHQQQQQHFVGIPLHQQSVAVPDVPVSHGLLPLVQHNSCPGNNSVDQTTTSQLPSTQQGLSLSLSPQQPSYTIHLPPPPSTVISPRGGEHEARFLGSPSSAVSGPSNGFSGSQGAPMGSKYLMAAQQLLDEVVNLGKGLKDESPKAAWNTSRTKANQGSEDASSGETNTKRPVSELTTAERQDLQMKKAKLVNMLDEVEKRYGEYHHQMQILVSTFEAIAGPRSARTYTAVALQTISKKFRCLRDAISCQIGEIRKNLGEEDCLLGSKPEGRSRLRFVDHQLRQHTALQQLGMMQQNAWRPQRGLPERSVSILRAWLFEHFLHPYPKNSDKHMLAKKTGLSRNQVSNWFINARVRLWKPMVEEMYMEETKEQEKFNNNTGDEKATNNKDSASKPTAPPPLHSTAGTEHGPTQQVMIPTPPPPSINGRIQTGYDKEADEMIHSKLKKARSCDSLNLSSLTHHNHHQMQTLEMGLKQVDTSSNSDLFLRFSEGGGFGGYPIGEMSRFGSEQFMPQTFSSNGVSLTLGLQHCEGLSLSGAQSKYLSTDGIPLGRRLHEMSTSEANDYSSLNNSSSSSSNNMTALVGRPRNAYENISIQDRERFAAQLLPDYVA